MKNFKHPRTQIIKWIFEKSIRIYARYFKKNKLSWNIKKNELIKFKNNSLGKELYLFLERNKLDLVPKSEYHDCYHILTNYQVKVKDEIALQYLLFANGKRTVNLFLIIIVGTILLPDYLSYYLKSYRKGKLANPFYQLDFQKLLNAEISEIQSFIFTKKQIINHLNTSKYV